MPDDLRDLGRRRGVAAALGADDAVDDGHADAGQVESAFINFSKGIWRPHFERAAIRETTTGTYGKVQAIRREEQTMETVTVYKVGLYDALNDEPRISRRMATIKGAAQMRGWIIDGTGIEIDPALLEPSMQWTARDFNPNSRGGFQTQVTG
jgi:hypothetical protein